MKLKMPKLSKKQSRLVIGAIISGVIIICAIFYFPFSSTFIGGSSWGFDYQLSWLEVNGVPQGGEDLPGDVEDTPDWQEEHTCPFCGVQFGSDEELRNHIAFAHGPIMDVRTSYEWWTDLDGDPIYDGAVWHGLEPDIGVTMSLPWRVDAEGTKVAPDYDDPLAPLYVVGDEVKKLYFYSFDILVKTAQSQFTVPGPLGPWQSAECGVMDVDVTLTVAMLKRFPDAVIGEFMDCKVLEVDMQDIQLQSGLAWEVTPSMAPKQDVNQGIPISNRNPTDEAYTCDLLFTCTLTPGLARSGDNLLPYDVFVRKVVQMSVLLTGPLIIGPTGEPQDPFKAPIFIPPMDPFTMILIILGIILAIVILVVVFRALGVVGSIARVIGVGKSAKG